MRPGFCLYDFETADRESSVIYTGSAAINDGENKYSKGDTIKVKSQCYETSEDGTSKRKDNAFCNMVVSSKLESNLGLRSVRENDHITADSFVDDTFLIAHLIGGGRTIRDTENRWGYFQSEKPSEDHQAIAVAFYKANQELWDNEDEDGDNDKGLRQQLFENGYNKEATYEAMKKYVDDNLLKKRVEIFSKLYCHMRNYELTSGKMKVVTTNGKDLNINGCFQPKPLEVLDQQVNSNPPPDLAYTSKELQDYIDAVFREDEQRKEPRLSKSFYSKFDSIFKKYNNNPLKAQAVQATLLAGVGKDSSNPDIANMSQDLIKNAGKNLRSIKDDISDLAKDAVNNLERKYPQEYKGFAKKFREHRRNTLKRLAKAGNSPDFYKDKFSLFGKLDKDKKKESKKSKKEVKDNLASKNVKPKDKKSFSWDFLKKKKKSKKKSSTIVKNQKKSKKDYGLLKNYELKNNDVHKKSSQSLFQLISQRYIRSLNKLHDEK